MKSLLFSAMMAINIMANAQSYFGSASNPVDNGTNATFVVSVTPPASMVNGDLIILIAEVRTANETIDIDNAGGQTWRQVDVALTNTTQTSKIWWARYTGSWSAHPAVVFGTAPATTLTMHVFRPGTATNTWALDQAATSAQYAAPVSPFSVTQTGATTVNAKAVAIAYFSSNDDNAWTQTGATWLNATDVQYRNLGGSDMSHSIGYQLLATAGTATGDCTKRQTANGGDAGVTALIIWYEFAPTNRGMPLPLLGN